MAKKQQRYRGAEIVSALRGLKGQNISLILEGRQVYQLRVQTFEKDLLVASDGLHRVHRFPVNLIDEVIVEKHA